jgi:hypothetical protein
VSLTQSETRSRGIQPCCGFDVRDVLEDSGLDRVEEAADLHGGLLVAARGAGGRRGRRAHSSLPVV